MASRIQTSVRTQLDQLGIQSPVLVNKYLQNEIIPCMSDRPTPAPQVLTSLEQTQPDAMLVAMYERDDGALTKDQLNQLTKSAPLATAGCSCNSLFVKLSD